MFLNLPIDHFKMCCNGSKMNPNVVKLAGAASPTSCMWCREEGVDLTVSTKLICKLHLFVCLFVYLFWQQVNQSQNGETVSLGDQLHVIQRGRSTFDCARVSTEENLAMTCYIWLRVQRKVKKELLEFDICCTWLCSAWYARMSTGENWHLRLAVTWYTWLWVQRRFYKYLLDFEISSGLLWKGGLCTRHNTDSYDLVVVLCRTVHGN